MKNKLKLILSEQEYQEVAKRLEELRMSKAGNKDDKELKVLTKALVQYQRRNRPNPGCGISQVRY
jgi:hypothetical protein